MAKAAHLITEVDDPIPEPFPAHGPCHMAKGAPRFGSQVFGFSPPSLLEHFYSSPKRKNNEAKHLGNSNAGGQSWGKALP